jgi:hypothetical protein
MGGQAIVALCVGLPCGCRTRNSALQHAVHFPFFKRLIPDLGWGYVPFAVLVL